MQDVVDNLKIRETLHLKLVRIQVCLNGLFNYSSMIDIVFFFWWYNVTQMITSGNVNFDMFRFDNLGQML